MTQLPVTYKDLAKFLHPFNNTIYKFTYELWIAAIKKYKNSNWIDYYKE